MAVVTNYHIPVGSQMELFLNLTGQLGSSIDGVLMYDVVPMWKLKADSRPEADDGCDTIL